MNRRSGNWGEKLIDFSKRNIRIWSLLGPGGALSTAAMELGEVKPEVQMMTADLNYYSGLKRFSKAYPGRLINVGIAEQNLIGVAAGLAKEGYMPFANTYASFCASRCADQIRVNMAYMKLPIKLIGLSAGLDAGVLGATHMAVEDLAVMRSLPNITVLSPADCTEIIKAVLASSETPDPTYIRLTGPMNMPIVYNEDYDFQIGKAVEIRPGRDICIIATGSMVYHAVSAAELLEMKGISCAVINMHTVKPLDTEAVDAMLDKKMIVTVEEASIIGGLGSAVAEYLALQKSRPYQIMLGIRDSFPTAGSYDYLLKQCRLTGEQIAEDIISALSRE